MRTRQVLARLFVLGLVAGTSREALARGDVRPDSASLPMTERPPEVRLGHELGLPDVTLRRHPLGSYGMTLVTYPDPLPTSHSDAPRLRGELLVGGGPAVRRSREALELPLGVALSLRLWPRLDLTGDVAARAAVHPEGAAEGGDAASLDWFAWMGFVVHL